MKSKIHILHTITDFDVGGAENHVLELVRHQLALGLEVSVAYLRGHGEWIPTVRGWGGEVYDLRLRYYGDFRPFRALRQLLKAKRFSLVHAHLPPAELYTRCALLGLADAPPFIISKHNDCPFHRFPGETLVERWVASRASAVIAISHAVHQYMSGRGIAPERLVTIPYGIDISPFEAVCDEDIAACRQEWGIADGQLVIGFVGRLVEQKAIDILIRGFAEFVRRTKVDAKLVILGKGALHDELHRCAEQEGMADRIVWVRFRADIPLVMKAFDVFALTSNFEGFGLVLVEAMAAGRPVMATRVSAIPEVVGHGEAGILVPPRSPEAVADALTRLTDPVLRERLGSAGARRVFEHFTLERMWQSTDETYLRFLPAEAAEAFQPSDEHAVFATPVRPEAF
jgi:glycosyltransferase involved in cell wall biosynthesis